MKPFLSLLVLMLLASFAIADNPPLVSGQITVLGSRIEVSPSLIETPSGIPVVINTTGQGISGTLIGELRGPSIQGAVSFQTSPGQQFQLPPLPTEGTYFFEDIRLVRDGQIVLSATPDQIEIRVIQVLVTSISSRPLTLEEIRGLGIVINEDDFSAVTFEVGLTFNSQQVRINFPLLLPKKPNLQPMIPPPVNSASLISPVPPRSSSFSSSIPQLIPVSFKPQSPDFNLNLPDIPGVLIFPNEIAFLNQFFAVVLMVRNGASEGSPLAVDNLTAQIVLDPQNVELVETNPSVPLGSPVPVRLPGVDGEIGTGDDVDLIIAGQTAEAEFFVEGLSEGTHTVRMNLEGTLSGLAQGDVPITGTATGAILVRNPNFAITFSHPSVVRAFEEYDLFITITNTSQVDANLVRLSIPQGGLINSVLKSDPYQDFETIKSGESAIATFRIEPRVTGQVTAAVMTSSDGVNGRFEFRIGVGEKGIPLSPNTLILPESASALGPDFMQKGLSFLGLAYSAATAPPGGLPPGVPYTNKNSVFQRAVEMAQAGHRFQLGESRMNTLSHLILDWLGNDFNDPGIDQLRRTTEKGRLFMDELFSQINVGANNALTFHQDFAQSTFFRNPYISVVLQSAGTAAPLSVVDSDQKILSSSGGEFGPATGIPNGELLSSEDNGAYWALIGNLPSEFPQSYSYSVRIAGNGDPQTLSIIVPFESGFYRAQFSTFSTIASVSYQTTIDESSLQSGTLEIKDQLGTTVATGFLLPVNGVQQSAISTRQDEKADKTGHIIAVLFNQPVSVESANNRSNYQVDGNEVLDAKLQNGGRIVYLAFRNPISPLIDNDLTIRGIDPPHPGASQTLQIQTTVTTDAGRVLGRVLGPDGAPIALSRVQLLELDQDDLFGETTLHVTASTITNAQGEFAFDYVRKLSRPFTIQAEDPNSGDVGSSSAVITQPNQLIRLDIIMLGRGTITGQVFQMVGGSREPMTGALVSAVPLTNPEQRNVLTDQNGRFTIDRLPVGNVNLTAQNQDLSSPNPFFGAASVEIPSAGSLVQADIEVTVRAAGRVRGRVLQANAIDPIVNAYVLLNVDVGGDHPLFLSAFSDDQGWFEFPQVPSGLIHLQATDAGTGQVIGNTSVHLPAGGNVVANIVAQGSGSIEVHIIPATGMLLSEIAVQVSNTAFIRDPANMSPVLFEGVPVGNWNVRAIYKPTGEQVNGTASIPFAGAVAGISLRFPEKGTIRGDVVTVDGLAAANSTVLLFGGTLQSSLVAVTETDATGHYLFENISFGEYAVHAISQNQNDGGSSGIVRVSNTNRNPEADIPFIGKGIIQVHVESSAGPVVAPVRLETTTFESDGRIRRSIVLTQTTDINGNTTFTNIFRLPFRVIASTPLTTPAIVNGNLTGPSAEVNVTLTDNPTISGIVHDANGQPIQAMVTYQPGSDEQSLTTDPQGRFTFTDVAQGRGVFRASAGGSLGEVVVHIQDVNPDIHIHLLGFGSVTGMVKDAASNPVPNASVKLTVRGLLAHTLQTTTDASGMYRFENVPEGPITLEASNGVSGAKAGSEIIHNSEISFDLILAPTGSVQGTVYKFNGTTPIASAELTLFQSGSAVAYSTSDGNGNFLFDNVPLGAYRVHAFDNNTGRHGESDSFAVASDGETVTQDVLMEARGSVSGTVYDYSGSNALPGVRLSLRTSGLSPQTLLSASRSDGTFDFDSVPKGNFTIQAQADFLAKTVSGAINTDDEEEEIDIFLEPSADINGSIVYANGTSLPPGIVPIVDIIGDGVNLKVDAPDGSFFIADLPLQHYTLKTRFTYNGIPYRGITSIDITNPGQNNVTLPLLGLKTINLTIQGTLLDITTVTLVARNQMGNERRSIATTSNNVSFPFVPESDFTVTVRTEDPQTGARLGGSTSGTITGDGPPPYEAVVILAPAGTVKGVVKNGALPATGALVTTTAGTLTLVDNTDSLGRFQFDGVPAGSYAVIAEDLNSSGRARVRSSIAPDQMNNHEMILDFSPPSISSVEPAPGEDLVSTDRTIHIVFNEPMDPSTTENAFSLRKGNGSIPGNVNVAGNELTFVPSAPLLPQQTYTIVVQNSAEDSAGHALPAAHSSTFTTIDTVLPALTASIPLNLAFNVPLNTSLTLFFSEPIDSLGSYTFQRNPAGPPITVHSEVWNPSRTSVAFTFSEQLRPNERITFEINGFTDTAGNSNSATILFDTIDTQPPAPPSLVSSANPIREGTSVSLTASAQESPVNVDFYVNGLLRKHDTSAPFNYEIPAALTKIDVNGGTQLLAEASATDRSGNTSARTPMPITLLPDNPPVINITGTTPPQGNVPSGGTINVRYSVGDDGFITQVLIIATGAYNTTLIGPNISGSVDIHLPVDLPDGSSIFVSARATDDSGKSTTTPQLTFTVSTGGIIIGTVRENNEQLVSGAVATLVNDAGTFTETTDSEGRFQFNGVAAGSFVLTVTNPVSGFRARTAATIASEQTLNLSLNLLPSGDIQGTVFNLDGVTPVEGAKILVGNRDLITGSDGTFFFDVITAGFPIILAKDTNNFLRYKTNVNLANGETKTVNLTFRPLGTVTGSVRNPDSSPAINAPVRLQSFDPIIGGFFNTTTDFQGRYQIAGVPAADFNVTVDLLAQQLYGENTGAIGTEAEIVSTDIQLQSNSITLPRNLSDANGKLYDIQSYGGLANGTDDAFDTAMSLRVNIGFDSYFFSGNSVGTIEDSGREVVIQESDLGGIDVRRKIFVPENGYFARYLDTLTNPHPAPITFSVEISSILGTNEGIRLIQESTGEQAWIITDDDDGANRFAIGRPAISHIYAGAGNSVDLEPAVLTSSGAVFYGWNNITLQPGETITLMHIVSQQFHQPGALASAQRIVQLPPELLSGLSSEEISAIRNFAVPPDGISSLPEIPLPQLGTVAGSVFAHDGSTPITSSLVNFRGDDPIFGRSLIASTNSSGQFTMNNVPIGPYTVAARHPDTGVISSEVPGDFPAGQTSSNSNIVFSNTGNVQGVVRRHNGTLVTSGTIRIEAESPDVDVVKSISSDGSFIFTGLPEGTYVLTANISGLNISGTADVEVQTGETTIQDVTIEPTGAISGVVRNAAGNPIEDIQVRLERPGFIRFSTANSSGQFNFNDVPAGNFTLKASVGSGQSGASVPVTVVPDQTTIQDITLGVGILNLQVNLSDGNPAANRPVNLFEDARGSSRFVGNTNASGQLSITNVAIGNFSASACHPNNSQACGTFSGTISFDGDVVAGIITLPAVASLRVTVLLHNGSPLINSRVEVRDQQNALLATGNTNSSGIVSFNGFTAGNYTATASIPNRLSITGISNGTVGPNDEGQVIDIAVTALSGTIEGFVFAADGETGVQDRSVSIENPLNGERFSTVISGPDGQFNFNNMAVPLEGFRVVTSVCCPSEQYETSGNLNAPGDSISLSITIPVSIIRGTVRYSDNTTPVANPIVRIVQFNTENQYNPISIDEEGNYKFIEVQKGEFEISATDPETGLSVYAISEIVDFANVLVLDLTLPATGTVIGAVFDSEGNPVPFADVAVSSLEDGSETFSMADENGNFTMDLVRTGGVLVQACIFTDSAECGTATGTMTTAGETITTNIHFPQTNSPVHGTVFLPDGVTPAASAFVSISTLDYCGPLGCPGVTVVADELGNFSASVAAGEVVIDAIDSLEVTPGRITAQVDAVEGAGPLIVPLGNIFIPECSETCEAYVLSGADSIPYGVIDNALLDEASAGAYISPYSRAFRLRTGRNYFSNNVVIQTPEHEITSGPNIERGLVVNRKVFVPAGGRFARYLDVIRNPHDAPVSISISIDGFHRSILQTSPDTTNNTYAIASPGECCDSALGFVFGAPSAPTQLSSIRFPFDDDYFSYRWNITIPPNETVILMHFAIQRDGGNTSGAEIQTQALVNLSDPDALTGMTPAERSKVVNFNVP